MGRGLGAGPCLLNSRLSLIPLAVCYTAIDQNRGDHCR